MIPDNLQKIIDDALDHRVRRPTFNRDTLLIDIEFDGLERQEVLMGMEDELSCDIPDIECEKWQSVGDICATYEAMGGA